jgi:protein SCO1/2
MKHMKKILLLILLGLIVQLPLGAFDKNSLYQMPIKFKNQKNETVSLGQFSGQKTVLALFFSSCQYACPLILAEMKKIEKGLSAGQRQKINWVMVSIDPETDTPEVLAAFAKQKQIEHYQLLTGREKDIRKLSALLETSYRKTGIKNFDHAILITVLDEKGVMAHQQLGNGQDLSELFKKLK